MKITKVEIEKFQAELMEPFRVAFTTVVSADTWTVKVHTDEGIYGVGSAAPFEFVTGETMDTCKIVLDMFAKAFIGFDPLDIAGAHALMDSMIYSNGSSKCAFDIALYDIAGKYYGVPVWKLLQAPTNVVETDMTVGINDPAYMAAEAKRFVQEKGFRILKIKVGIGMEHDIEALRLIRQAVGNDVIIRVDANQGYTVDAALALLPEFEKLGVAAVEQFLPYWDFDGAAEIKRRNTTAVKLMLDESIHDHHDAERAVSLGCADFFNIKLMKCGGLYNGAKIADVAAANGVQCMVGCMMENKISITAAASLVAAKSAIVEADCDSFMSYKGEDDGLTGGLHREGGLLILSDRPGLGLDI